MKSDKMSYIIMPTLNLWFKKIDGCANYPEKSWTIEIAEPIPCRYLMSAIRGFNNIENKHTLYCGEDCMKKFCTSLIEHTTNVIIFEKKNATVNKKGVKIA